MLRKRFTAAVKRHYLLRANPARAVAAARAQVATAAPPPAAVALVAIPAPRGRTDVAGGGLKVLKALQWFYGRAFVEVQGIKSMKAFGLSTSGGQINNLI